MEQNEFQTYVDMAARRKWWIIIPFLLTLLAGFAYFMFAPKLYEANAVVFVQEQSIAKAVVDPIVSGADDRFTILQQRVTSRPNLVNILAKYDLYGSAEAERTPGEKVASFKEAIEIEPTYQTYPSPNNASIQIQRLCAFTVFFRYEDPEMAAEVTNTLASNFISENLRIKEDLVLGTSNFLDDELASVEKKIAMKEAEIKQFREKYMGGLPGQLEVNLNFLDRYRQQLDKLKSSLREAEDKKMLLQEQIAVSTVIYTSGEPISTDSGSLRRELASLQLKYSDNHPDIIRLKKMIAKVDEEMTKLGTNFESGDLLPGVDDKLRFEFQQALLDIKNIKAEIAETNSRIREYEAVVLESPQREQELLGLERDYDNLKHQYKTLFDRKLEVETTASMESKQKGEQFRIIETALPPTSPVAPKLKIVMILSLALGLGLGSGAAVLKEYTDTSYKAPEEIKAETQLPVFVSLPFTYSEIELKTMKRKRLFAYWAMGLGFVLSLTVIVLAANGVDATMEAVQSFFSSSSGIQK